MAGRTRVRDGRSKKQIRHERNLAARWDALQKERARKTSETGETIASAAGEEDQNIERKRTAQWQLNLILAAAIVLAVAGLALFSYPFILKGISQNEQNAVIARQAAAASQWPYPQEQDAIKAAQEYNKQLYESGQPIMGQVKDPFDSGADGGDSASITASPEYKHYMSLLNEGVGVEGSVIIPKISVNLPIYHGTSETVLASGAGQMYGSSFPVPGDNVRSVIAAHTGFLRAMMFTRLTEMKVGDFFYIKTMGQTYAFRVTSIQIILPTDADAVKIIPGKDMVTLLTCYPYGINTHRLLVNGVATSMPYPAPYPGSSTDPLEDALWCLLGVVLTLAILWPFLARRNYWKHMMHARERKGY